MGYLPDHLKDYEYAPIHIDYTGDTVYDAVASIGFEYDDVYEVFVQGTHPEAVDLSDDADSVTIRTFDSERELLSHFTKYVEKALDPNDVVFVGYKSETWRGGSFKKLRTRCVRNKIPWPFDGMYYVDFGEAIAGKGRFNTSVPSMSGANVAPLDDFIDFYDLNVDKSLNRDPKRNAIEAEGYTVEEVREFSEATGHDVPYDSLDGLQDVHGMFSDEDLLDPIESETAIRDLVEVGDTDELVQHTVADIARTEELFRLADEFTSRDDWHITQL